jgi:hypothetical protein
MPLIVSKLDRDSCQSQIHLNCHPEAKGVDPTQMESTGDEENIVVIRIGPGETNYVALNGEGVSFEPYGACATNIQSDQRAGNVDKDDDEHAAAILRDVASSHARVFVEHMQKGEIDEANSILRRSTLRASIARKRIGVPSSVASVSSSDWQSRLDECLRADQSQQARLLFELTRDFNDIAKTYGQIIILERHLRDEEKSIAPKNLGGVAGGQKYVVANIVFKFAQDVKLENGEYLYGGDSPDDEAAHKAAVRMSVCFGG